LRCQLMYIGYWGLECRLLSSKRILPPRHLGVRGGKELLLLFVACRYFLGLVEMEVEVEEVRGV
jgi:hypothetical protein